MFLGTKYNFGGAAFKDVGYFHWIIFNGILLDYFQWFIFNGLIQCLQLKTFYSNFCATQKLL